MAQQLPHASSCWALLGICFFLQTKWKGHSRREREGAFLSSWATPPLPPNSRKGCGGPNYTHGEETGKLASFTGCCAKPPWLRRLTGSVLTQCLNLIRKTSILRHLHNVLAEAKVSPLKADRHRGFAGMHLASWGFLGVLLPTIAKGCKQIRLLRSCSFSKY